MTAILILTGLLLWSAAGMIINNEYNARRNSIVPTIVLGNTIAATINIVVGLILIATGISQLFSR